MVRQTLAPRTNSEAPWTGLDEIGFERRSETSQLGDTARPIIATRSTLIAKAPHVILLGGCLIEVPEARDVDSVRSTPFVILIVEIVETGRRSHLEVVVH